MKKGVLRNFTKFTGKHLCQNLFFYYFSKNTFFTEHLWMTASLCQQKHLTLNENYLQENFLMLENRLMFKFVDRSSENKIVLIKTTIS